MVLLPRMLFTGFEKDEKNSATLASWSKEKNGILGEEELYKERAKLRKLNEPLL